MIFDFKINRFFIRIYSLLIDFFSINYHLFIYCLSIYLFFIIIYYYLLLHFFFNFSVEKCQKCWTFFLHKTISQKKKL